MAGCRIRGNEYSDFTGVVATDAKMWGHAATLVTFDGTCSLSLGIDNPGGAPPYNRNRDDFNITFEPTYYGSDSRNGGSNPPASIIGIDEANPWGTGENATTRTARGPVFNYIFQIFPSATLKYPPYTAWHNWGTSVNQGFKGLVGSPKPYGTCLDGNTSVDFTRQYWSTMFVEAAAGETNITPGSTPAPPSTASLVSANETINTGLNIRLNNFDGGVYYNYAWTVVCATPTVLL
jgi:hypothetical protein